MLHTLECDKKTFINGNFVIKRLGPILHRLNKTTSGQPIIRLYSEYKFAPSELLCMGQKNTEEMAVQGTVDTVINQTYLNCHAFHYSCYTPDAQIRLQLLTVVKTSQCHVVANNFLCCVLTNPCEALRSVFSAVKHQLHVDTCVSPHTLQPLLDPDREKNYKKGNLETCSKNVFNRNSTKYFAKSMV